MSGMYSMEKELCEMSKRTLELEKKIEHLEKQIEKYEIFIEVYNHLNSDACFLYNEKIKSKEKTEKK